MYVPAGLDAFDDLIYRTGRIARSEVLLQYANEQLFYELVGRESRGVHALPTKSHSGIIDANRRMISSSGFEHGLKKIALALFKRAKAAISQRDEVIHGVFIILDEESSMIRINGAHNSDLRWTNERFEHVHTALRRARRSTEALQEIVAGAKGDEASLRLIIDDMFVLYGNNSAMASTPEGRRTEPELQPTS